MDCRYCQLDKKLTREHIIPNFIYKFQHNSGLPKVGWNQKANDVIGGEAKIGDVCEECNNGPLSDLDAYGQNFLITNGFLSQTFTKTSTDIYYDYFQLIRWLMKISYNAATAVDDKHASAFDMYRDFILTGQPEPGVNDIVLFAGISSPLLLTGKLEEETNIVVTDDNLCAPFYMRITQNNNKYLQKGIIKRELYFGSIFFHIAICKNSKISKNQFVRELCNTESIKYISPNTSACHVKTCGKTWFEINQEEYMIECEAVGYETMDAKMKKLKIPKK